MYMSIVPQRAVSAKSVPSTRAHKRHVRMIRTVVLIGMMAASIWLGAQIHVSAADETAAEHAPAISESHVRHAVEPGDTLWAIAKIHLPEGASLQQFIHDIRQFNGMSTSQLQAGQVLNIPVQP